MTELSADLAPDAALARPLLADGVALGLSGACLAHCLALPVVVAAAPALGASLFAQPFVHPVLLALAAPAAVWAIGLGARRHGRWVLPALLAGIGLGVMLLGAAPDIWHDAIHALAIHDLWHAAEQPLTVLGVSVLAAAHVLNWRRTAAAAPHCTTHGHVHHRH